MNISFLIKHTMAYADHLKTQILDAVHRQANGALTLRVIQRIEETYRVYNIHFDMIVRNGQAVIFESRESVMCCVKTPLSEYILNYLQYSGIKFSSMTEILKYPVPFIKNDVMFMSYIGESIRDLTLFHDIAKQEIEQLNQWIHWTGGLELAGESRAHRIIKKAHSLLSELKK